MNNTTKLEQARRNLRPGDIVTEWEGEVRHRYAGIIATFTNQNEAAEALRKAGFKAGYASRT